MRWRQMPSSSVNPYADNFTGCHAQALALAEPRLAALGVAWLDILSTVPAGIVVRCEKPLRFLDCLLDPDLALDRALDLLGVRYQVRWWTHHDENAAGDALELLRGWLAEGPVVLGPVAMARLPYLPYANVLYDGVDHYLVARGMQGGRLVVDDPEGYRALPVVVEAILPALRGDGLPEGRGAFTMRRILAFGDDPARALGRGLEEVMRLSAENMQAAAARSDGGAQAIRRLALSVPELLQSTDTRQKLLHDLGRRVERCLLLTMLLGKARPDSTSASLAAASILDRQVAKLADAIATIWQDEGAPKAVAALADFADEEERLNTTWQDIVLR